MGHVTILVGAQWGDEGKGKWIDILSEGASLVARFQGGNNAGHTIYRGDEKIVLHQIPSGIFQKDLRCALMAGVVINPAQLVKEMEAVSRFAEVSPARLWLSPRAHIISPWHIFLDEERENASGSKIGTTRRGIGPTYMEKAARLGLRLGHYVDDTARNAWVEELRARASKGGFTFKDADWSSFHASAAALRPFVRDAEVDVRHVISSDAKILLEGAQGTLLDLDHGTYPYVTSSSTAAGGACASIGFSPKKIGNVLGVAKAYLTRVGGGPMPSELLDSVGEKLREKGQEFGATTGRPRRCGWLDAVALRYSAAINGLDGLILNKIDVLSGFSEVKIATAYRHPQLGRIVDFPWDPEVLEKCVPEYESYTGWPESLSGMQRRQDFPASVSAFINAVEKHVGVPVVMVGTGVKRADAVFMNR